MALILPFIFFSIVFVIINIANKNAKPQYDYIYVTGDTSCIYNYAVSNKTLIIQQNYTDCNNSQIVIYRHLTKENSNEVLNYDEASRLSLDSNYKSPDGYTFEYYNSGFIFGGGYSNDKYLNGNGASLKQNLEIKSNFQFIGWVINN